MFRRKKHLKINELSITGKISIELLFLFTALICFIPFWLIISISFSTEADIAKYGFTLFPKHFTLDAYSYLFKGGSMRQIINAYLTTIFITVSGTTLGVMVTAMAAYAMTRKLKYIRQISLFYSFAMMFSGGTVAWYMICTQVLHLTDTYFALILPYAVSVWNVIMLRTFMKSSLPEEVFESVKIDGGGECVIFFKFVLPMSLPGLATIALYLALHYWNDWYLSMMLINKAEIVTLQYYMQKVMNSVMALIEFGLREGSSSVNLGEVEMPRESIKMAICLIAIGPILLASPFLQKFFIKGINSGAVKG